MVGMRCKHDAAVVSRELGKPSKKPLEHCDALGQCYGMSMDVFLALLAFAAIAAHTPGPNNTMLMASGISFGFRKSVPHILGVSIGFPAMIALVGLGMMKVFEVFPLLYPILKYAGAVYMLWLAWKIASSTPGGEATAVARPLTFLQAALFQWINPKGWVMAVTALTTYTAGVSYAKGVAIVALSFLVNGFSSTSIWVLFGTGLRRFLNDPVHARKINIGLALTLVASLVPMLWH
jgi:threonine/homoserine/homoserine lactone efflux protein